MFITGPPGTSNEYHFTDTTESEPIDIPQSTDQRQNATVPHNVKMDHHGQPKGLICQIKIKLARYGISDPTNMDKGGIITAR